MKNEKRLIDANALNAVIRGIAKNIKRPSAVELMCLCQIAEQPTVDAVEVIRCKDCKHWKDEVSGCTDHVKCCEIGFYMVGENGYCVYGEKEA